MVYALYGAVFWLPVIGVLFGLGVVLLARSVTAPMWMRRRASCGGCGYELESLGAGVCPECGASLIRVGVATPRMAVRLRGSGFLLVIGWTLIVTMATLPILGFGIRLAQSASQRAMMPGTTETVRTLQANLEPSTFAGFGQQGQRLPEAYSIKVEARVDNDTFGMLAGGKARLEFVGTPNQYILEYELGTKAWQLKDGKSVVIEGTDFDMSDSERVYSAVGLDINRTTTSDEAVFLPAMIDQMLTNPAGIAGNMNAGNPLGFNGFSSRVRQKGNILGTGLNIEQFTPPAIGVIAALVYAIGLYLFLRRRARLLRATAIH